MPTSGGTTGSGINIISNIDYLIPDLRIQLGDTDATAYKYIDEWLSKSLIVSIKALGRWWRFKYLVDELNQVSRNSLYPFTLSSPPIVEMSDERPIILMASIIIKGGDLEKNAWSIGTWRDAEVYYSNNDASKAKQDSIKRDWDELTSYLQAPTKRLARALKGSLPGYLNNLYEGK